MIRKVTRFLAIILAMMFTIAATSEAKPLDRNQTLSSKQQGIIPIAAFTATGKLEKLKIALNAAPFPVSMIDGKLHLM